MSQTLSSIPFNRLPLGFRFHPTDVELINHYLKRKINGQIKPADAAIIPEIDVCRFEPWDLPSKSAITSDDAEWFFFAPVDRKYPSGNRSNRATEAGYWKATGNDRFIRSRTRGGEVVVGMKKTLVFHKGRAPKGKRSRWIMHEYRAVEPEFEEGGFVLCRLFKKPEETVPVAIAPEPEESGFSPTPTNPSQSNTLCIEDVFDGEFATPLNQKPPEPNMLEESQSLPDTSNDPLTENKLADKANDSLPYPIKPEENLSNSNTGTDKGGQEPEMAVGEDTSLYDELLPLLGPEYDHLLSDDYFPQINAIASDVDQGLHTQVQYPKLEEDSVLDLLESILGSPEMSAGMSANDAGSATKVVPQEQSYVMHQGTVDNDSVTYVVHQSADSEALPAQGGLRLHRDASDTYKAFRSSTNVSGSSSRKWRNRASKLKPEESGTLPGRGTKPAEDLIGQANSMATEINIRHRNSVNLESAVDSLNLESAIDSHGRQGIAERRIHLQSRVRRFLGDNRPGNQTTGKPEVSEPTFVGDHDHFSDEDGTSSTYHARALQVEGYGESRARLRAAENKDADKTMEKSSLSQETSRFGYFPIRRIGVLVLVVVSLICAGTVWLVNS